MIIPIKYHWRFKEEKTHQKLELNRHTLFDQSVQMKIVAKVHYNTARTNGD